MPELPPGSKRAPRAAGRRLPVTLMRRVPVSMLMRLLPLALLIAACSPSIPPLEAGVVIPVGFPADVPIPEGSFTREYTGSAEIGFELRVMTAMAPDDLKEFVLDAVEASDSWPLTSAGASLPVLPGYDADWAIFTRDGEVIAGPFGTYEGGIGITGSEINILLTPTVQPAADKEPPVLPARSVLPRPNTRLDKAAYAQGRVNLTYEGKVGAFDSLIDRYRTIGWDERQVSGYGQESMERAAVGDLANWRITVRDYFGLNEGPIILEFENLTLSFP